jgi:hypothetical protein
MKSYAEKKNDRLTVLEELDLHSSHMSGLHIAAGRSLERQLSFRDCTVLDHLVSSQYALVSRVRSRMEHLDVFAPW